MADDGCYPELGQFIPHVPGYEVVPSLVRLIANGEPVRVEEVAAFGGLAASTVESTLRGQPGTDWDDDGRIVGFGLTLRPTAHRFIVSGRTLYTFCSTDALIFPAILGESAVAESICPATGQAIRIAMTPDAVLSIDPDGAVVSQLLDPRGVGDVRSQVCDQGHFFASMDAARDWADAHPHGRVLTVTEAFEEAQRGCEDLRWHAHSEMRP